MDDFYKDKHEDSAPDSVYSYSYKDRERSRTVHEGDYNADRDSYSQNHFQQGRTDETYSYYDASGHSDYGEPKHQKRRGRRGSKHAEFGVLIVKCAVLAVVFGLVSGGIFYGINRLSGSKTPEIASGQESTPAKIENTAVNTGTAEDKSVVVSDVSGIVDNVIPSIVAITNMSQTEYYNMFGQSQIYDSESCGSGIIVSDDEDYLYIATNNHVVAGAQSLTICFYDDTTVAAKIKGTDASSDLAVIAVRKKDMESDTLKSVKVASVGDSDGLRVGQPAIAIGNALGYGQSVTTGVISALNREVTTTDQSTGDTTTNELIQTDAAINPGNSGGALLNIKGEVVGINSIKYSDTNVEGMGYAIPAATAKPIIDELITRQAVDGSKSAFLGISGVDVTDEVSEAYDMPEGLYIAQVSQGSAADKAGIVKGDILTSFDGHKIRSMKSLDEQMQYYSAGTTVEVVVQRANNGRYVEKTISVKLGSKK